VTPYEAIAALMSLGFVQDGHTCVEAVRVPTRRSPVLGEAGGERRALGCRVRLALPGTDLRATVGALVTFVYRQLAPRSIEEVAHLATRDLASAEDLRRVVRGAIDDYNLDQVSDAGLLHDDVPIAPATGDTPAAPLVAPLAAGDYLYWVAEVDPPGDGLYTWRVECCRVVKIRRDGFVFERFVGFVKIHKSYALDVYFHRTSQAAVQAFVARKRNQIETARREIAEAERAIAFAEASL
jgi:hypothetical protein